MASALQQRIYKILESSDSNDLLSRLDDWGVTLLVILDVSTFIVETSKTITFEFNIFLSNIELISVFCFTVLYILQIWACTSDSKYDHFFWGRWKYATTPLAIIDLLAILPFYLLLIFPHDRLIESTDSFRLLRLLKLIRYSESLQTVARVIGAKKDELLMTLSTVLILLIFASSVMFYAENESQPETFSSIPAAMWWGVVTLTTVGYGDVYPVTPIGKLFGAGLAFIGIALFALPAGIIASGFSEEIQRRKESESNKLTSTTPATESISQLWTAEQEEAVNTYIEQSAELMKICIETAKRKFGDSFENEAIVRDLALSLYREAVRKFNG